MPKIKSKAQMRLVQAAAHGAATKTTLSRDQAKRAIAEYRASGKKKLPERVKGGNK
jgi:hypothetical protein